VSAVYQYFGIFSIDRRSQTTQLESTESGLSIMGVMIESNLVEGIHRMQGAILLAADKLPCPRRTPRHPRVGA